METEIIEQPTDIRTRIESAIASIDANTPTDFICNALVMLDAVKQFESDNRKALYAAILPILKDRGPIEIGTVKYYHGFTKPDWKCVDVAKAMEAVKLKAEKVNKETGEAVVDWSLVADCLSTGAFKPAATREFLGDEADKHFTREDPKGKVERKAPPVERTPKIEPSVQVIDTKFIR
jgi:hypothetical protein